MFLADSGQLAASWLFLRPHGLSGSAVCQFCRQRDFTCCLHMDLPHSRPHAVQQAGESFHNDENLPVAFVFFVLFLSVLRLLPCRTRR